MAICTWYLEIKKKIPSLLIYPYLLNYVTRRRWMDCCIIQQICVNVPFSDTLWDRGTPPFQFGQSLKECFFFVRWLFGISIWTSGASRKDWVVFSVQRAVWLASVWRKIGGNKISTQPLSIWNALTDWVLVGTIGHLVSVNIQQFDINQIFMCILLWVSTLKSNIHPQSCGLQHVNATGTPCFVL